jgi:hypothetical protein
VMEISGISWLSDIQYASWEKDDIPVIKPTVLKTASLVRFPVPLIQDTQERLSFPQAKATVHASSEMWRDGRTDKVILEIILHAPSGIGAEH